MINKLISIIIPVYNCEDYLSDCINSVVSQDYNNWEIILVDDHSTDSSFQICKNYSGKFSNVKAIVNEKKGVSSARNFGIENVSGDYIVFLDSDDMLQKNALNALMLMVEGHEFGMGTYSSIYTNGVREKHPIQPFEGKIQDFLPIIYNYILTPILQGPCWKIFKKDIIDKYQLRFPENMSYGEDAFFVYEYLLHIKTLKICDKDVYIYRISDISLSHGFKTVKFSTNLMLDGKVQHLCDCYHIDASEGSNKYVRDVFASLVNESSKSLSRHEAIIEIQRAASDERIIKAFRTIKGFDIKKSVIKQCIQYKLYGLLFFLGKMNAK